MNSDKPKEEKRDILQVLNALSSILYIIGILVAVSFFVFGNRYTTAFNTSTIEEQKSIVDAVEGNINTLSLVVNEHTLRITTLEKQWESFNAGIKNDITNLTNIVQEQQTCMVELRTGIEYIREMIDELKQRSKE